MYEAVIPCNKKLSDLILPSEETGIQSKEKTSKEGCQWCFREVSFKAAAINPSQAFPHSSQAQLSHRCAAAGFPLSHWDQASSTLAIPQQTITQQAVASALHTVSHLKREAEQLTP